MWRSKILDCQAEGKDWTGVEEEERIETFAPSVVASSGFTCNAYMYAKVAEIANPSIPPSPRWWVGSTSPSPPRGIPPCLSRDRSCDQGRGRADTP